MLQEGGHQRQAAWECARMGDCVGKISKRVVLPAATQRGKCLKTAIRCVVVYEQSEDFCSLRQTSFPGLSLSPACSVPVPCPLAPSCSSLPAPFDLTKLPHPTAVAPHAYLSSRAPHSPQFIFHLHRLVCSGPLIQVQSSSIGPLASFIERIIFEGHLCCRRFSALRSFQRCHDTAKLRVFRRASADIHF